jgi:hypothetical protein
MEDPNSRNLSWLSGESVPLEICLVDPGQSDYGQHSSLIRHPGQSLCIQDVRSNVAYACKLPSEREPAMDLKRLCKTGSPVEWSGRLAYNKHKRRK